MSSPFEIESAGPKPEGHQRFVDAAVGAAALSGIVLRVWILRSSSGALDSDEAVWGLMARHFEHGQFSTFFWGQSYGGTQETFFTVPLLWLFGSNAWTIRAVPIALWACASVLVWRVGCRTLGDERARIAAALFWTGSAYFVWKSTRAHGFYGSGLVFGLSAVLLALRLRDRDLRLEYAALGLVAGLAWWATPQSAILVLPAVLWLVAVRPPALRGTVFALPAFMVGSAPWWVYNIQHHWASLRPSADATTKLAHLHNLFSATLPTALGARVPWSLAWAPTAALGVVLYAVAVAWISYLLFRRPAGHGLLLLAVLIFPVLYTVSSYTWLNSEPRYLTMLFPVLALLGASAARSRIRIASVLALTLALTIVGIARIERDRLAAPQLDGVAVPAKLAPLLATLNARGVDRIYAGYWIAFRVAFESRERIVAATVNELSAQRYAARGRQIVPILGRSTGNEGRFPAYAHLVAMSRDAAHVFVSGAHGEAPIRRLLLSHGYRLARTGGFDVFLAHR